MAAFGHELRETFKGWLQLEKFFLLFGAVVSSWRALVMFWNLWGVTGDLLDKITVYFTFTLLTIIGVGAHGAFTVTRAYVASASFLATAVPLLVNAIVAEREELLMSKDNVLNQPAFHSVCQILVTTPYLAAAFVRSPTTARILFWIPPVAQIIATLFSMDLYKIISRNKADHTTIAVNIELFAEKYEVLTLIVLGESLIAILFEAARKFSEALPVRKHEDLRKARTNFIRLNRIHHDQDGSRQHDFPGRAWFYIADIRLSDAVRQR